MINLTKFHEFKASELYINMINILLILLEFYCWRNQNIKTNLN